MQRIILLLQVHQIKKTKGKRIEYNKYKELREGDVREGGIGTFQIYIYIYSRTSLLYINIFYI